MHVSRVVSRDSCYVPNYLATWRDCKVSPRVKNSLGNFLVLDFDRLAAARHCAAKFRREERVFFATALQSGYEKGSNGSVDAAKFIQKTVVSRRYNRGKGRVLFARCYLNGAFPRKRIASGYKPNPLTRDWIGCASVPPPPPTRVCDPSKR